MRFPARLVDRHGEVRDSVLVVSTGSTTVVARCAGPAARLDALPLGSLVEVTGIVALDWEFDPLAWPRQRPRSLALMISRRLPPTPSGW